jgi:hypothetical protein
MDLIGASLKPEDSAAVEAVLKAEVQQLQQVMGTAPAPQRQDTPTPTSAQPAGITGDDLLAKVRATIDKYNGDPDKLAKAVVNAQGLMTQATQGRPVSEDLFALRREVGELKNLIASQKQPPTPITPSWQAQPLTAAIPQEANEEFWKNAPTNISNIVNQSVQQNMAAFAEAFARQQATERERERFERVTESRAAEFEALKPVIDDIYARNPNRYDRMDQRDAYELLLDQAKDRAEAMRAKQGFTELSAIFGNGGTPGGQPAPQVGASVVSGVASRTNGVPQTTQDWSNTPSVKRLWRTPSGSTSEMEALTGALKERGFGDHIKPNY